MWFLDRYETNNGYRCSCCCNGDEYSEWVEMKDVLNFSSLLDKALSKNLDGIISRQYEKDGRVLYGYRTSFNKKEIQIYMIIGEKEYRIVAEGTDAVYLSREEILDKWEECLLSTDDEFFFTVL